MIRKLLQRSLPVFLTASLLTVAQPPRKRQLPELLDTVADKYESLDSYMLEGRESARIAGTDCDLDVPFQVVRGKASPAMRMHRVSPSPTIRFVAGRTSKTCNDAVADLGAIRPPAEWMEFERINVGVVSAHPMSLDILNIDGSDIRCSLVEVLYDDYYQKISGFAGPVQYWIDESTLMVRRIRFSEAGKQGVLTWTATIEKVATDIPMPQWATTNTKSRGHASLVGKLAPDFTLLTPEGKSIRLADLRGKLVLLDFWATWCYACIQEIPALERFQAGADRSQVILLGITGEHGRAVRDWLKRYNRSFLTLADGKKSFQDFGIEELPALVIVNRKGLIVDYAGRIGSEQRLRDFLTTLGIN